MLGSIGALPPKFKRCMHGTGVNFESSHRAIEPPKHQNTKTPKHRSTEAPKHRSEPERSKRRGTVPVPGGWAARPDPPEPNPPEPAAAWVFQGRCAGQIRRRSRWRGPDFCWQQPARDQVGVAKAQPRQGKARPARTANALGRPAAACSPVNMQMTSLVSIAPAGIGANQQSPISNQASAMARGNVAAAISSASAIKRWLGPTARGTGA